MYEAGESSEEQEELYEEPGAEDDYIPEEIKEENSEASEKARENVRQAAPVEVENDFEVPTYERAEDGEFRADDLLDAMLNKR